MKPEWFGAAAPALTQAANIYVASYAGPVFRLNFRQADDASYSLAEEASTLGCGINPGWLQLDKTKGVLYCLNEAYVGSPKRSKPRPFYPLAVSDITHQDSTP
jgi:hypothetical protein